MYELTFNIRRTTFQLCDSTLYILPDFMLTKSDEYNATKECSTENITNMYEYVVLLLQLSLPSKKFLQKLSNYIYCENINYLTIIVTQYIYR